MDAESYLHWLGTTDLTNALQSDVKKAVDVILAALQETSDHDSEMLDALTAIVLYLCRTTKRRKSKPSSTPKETNR
jgi:predicted RecB family endonuclease